MFSPNEYMVYAVTLQIGGARLLYVKNPWCCIRWRGQYGPYDEDSWSENLQQALNYDRRRRVCFGLLFNSNDNIIYRKSLKLYFFFLEGRY